MSHSWYPGETNSPLCPPALVKILQERRACVSDGEKPERQKHETGNVTHTQSNASNSLAELHGTDLRHVAGEGAVQSPTVCLLLFLSLSPVASPSRRLRSVHLSQLLPGRQVCQRGSRPGGPVPQSQSSLCKSLAALSAGSQPSSFTGLLQVNCGFLNKPVMSTTTTTTTTTMMTFVSVDQKSNLLM